VNLTVLLEKLLHIERSIKTESAIDVHRRVIDAQECLLQIHAQMVKRGRLAEETEDGAYFDMLRSFSSRYSLPLD
jgi:hypothetical protein